VDTYKELQRFDREGTRDIQQLVIDYVQAVIDDDWPALADDRLGQRTGALYDQLQLRVIAMKPDTAAQHELWIRIQADLDAVSDHRLVRLDNALAEPPVYLYVVYFGFLLTMVCFGIYRPQPPLLILVSLYTTFIGLVLYLILALSDPFQGGLGVSPDTFRQILETMRGGLP